MGASLILGLAGAGLSLYNQSRAEKKSNEAIVQGIRSQGERQQEADAMVDTELGKIRGSNPEAEREEAMQGFIDQLRRSRSGDPTNPNYGSSRFLSDTTAADQGAQDYATRTADIMSRISAPLRQREREQQGFARLESGLGGVARRASGDEFLTQLRAQYARPNAGLSFLSSALSGAGAGMASGGGQGGFNRGVRRVERGAQRVDLPASGLTSTAGLA